jgi:hypothetical protein
MQNRGRESRIVRVQVDSVEDILVSSKQASNHSSKEKARAKSVYSIDFGGNRTPSLCKLTGTWIAATNSAHLVVANRNFAG